MNTPPMIRLSNAIAEAIEPENLERLGPAELHEVAELLGMAQDAIRRRDRALGWYTAPRGRFDEPTEAELRLLHGDR